MINCIAFISESFVGTLCVTNPQIRYVSDVHPSVCLSVCLSVNILVSVL